MREWNRRQEEDEAIPDIGGADLSGADLRGADLSGADLRGADLIQADLSGADLYRADLAGAGLFNANIGGAGLSEAILTGADLSGADLRRADLTGAILTGTNLDRARLDGASCVATIFADVDLPEVAGLDSIRHYGPSHISTSTFIRSRGEIPEAFLRGCGLPDNWIDYLPSLIHGMQPIQFYSCFISYSSRDTPFAERLHADLQAKGVRCWFAPEDLKIGERIRAGIDESIRVHDKLLLILSKHSTASDWVEKEVETAMERERREKRTVLFPIRLDHAVLKVESGWPADIRQGRNIGDFRKWKDHDAFRKGFARLLRDLKAVDAAVGDSG